MPLTAHEVLNGRYEVIRSIKSGGMGAVYEAVDRNLAGSRCAVKEVLESALSGADKTYIMDTFVKEMQALAQLNHPDIPRVRDFFESNASRYIVMDLVVGRALDEELQERQRSGAKGLSPEQVGADMLGVLSILEYLHGLQPALVHRDVKPANLIRDQQSGRLKLVDFGLARSVESIKTQTQVGTPGYCAPEQMMGRAEPRSDLYSVGATLCHLVTGEAPRAFNFDAIVVSLPGYEDLSRIIAKATQPKVSLRYATAAEMAADLRLWLSGTPLPCEFAPSADTIPPAALQAALASVRLSQIRPGSPAPPAPRAADNREHVATILVGAMVCATACFGIYRLTQRPAPILAQSPVVVSPPTATHTLPPRPVAAREKVREKLANGKEKHKAIPPRKVIPRRTPAVEAPVVDVAPSYPQKDRSPSRPAGSDPSFDARGSHFAPEADRPQSGGTGFRKQSDREWREEATGTRMVMESRRENLDDVVRKFSGEGWSQQPAPANEACLYWPGRGGAPRGMHLFRRGSGLTCVHIEYSRPGEPSAQLLREINTVLAEVRSTS